MLIKAQNQIKNQIKYRTISVTVILKISHKEIWIFL